MTMDRAKLDELSRVVWGASVQARNEEAVENEDGVPTVIAWDDLSEVEKDMIRQPVSWMIDSVNSAVDSLYQERARQDFMAAAIEPSGQE